MMKAYINAIGIANPQYCTQQMKISEFMSQAINLNADEKRRMLAIYKASGIKERYSVISDFGSIPSEYTFFPNSPDLEPFPKISDRMDLYEKEALPLSLDAINDCLNNYPDFEISSLTHLITVSCTGMYAPGLDLEIVEAMRLQKNVQRTAVNYMGCYAAFNALKVANAICKSDHKAKVLIVCVELCTIHYQKKKNWDHILSNAIFGDGAAAIILEPQAANNYSFSLESFHCDISPEGKKDMAWHISDFGFEMTLSSYVPDMIMGGINNLTRDLLDTIGLSLSEIDYFAIHPGGRKILEAIEKVLSLTREHNRFAYEILSRYGNMSSPTVIFVLHSILKQLKKEDTNKNILSFAFGPGLTLESMLLKVHHVPTLEATLFESQELKRAVIY